MNTHHAPNQTALGHEPDNRANTRIPERLLWVAWISLLALTVMNLIIYVVGIPAYFAWYNTFHTTNCLDGCLTPATIQRFTRWISQSQPMPPTG